MVKKSVLITSSSEGGDGDVSARTLHKKVCESSQLLEISAKFSISKNWGSKFYT
jgi:hypothetical protein